MKIHISSFFKILLYAIICYSVLFIIEIPIFFIPESIYPNALISILVKQSLFLFSGFTIIFISKYYSFYSNINIKFSNTIFYYFIAILVIFTFCYFLKLIDAAQFITFKVTSLTSFGKFLIYCTIPTFFIGFGEELIFRWFLINRLKTFLKTYTAIVISSLIFCLGHNWNLPNLLFAFTMGCLFGIIYVRTDSIFYCISLHSAWNFGQRFFFIGMSEYSYNAQRLLFFKIKDIDYYNWLEFIFGISILVAFVIHYKLKDKKEILLIQNKRQTYISTEKPTL